MKVVVYICKLSLRAGGSSSSGGATRGSATDSQAAGYAIEAVAAPWVLGDTAPCPRAWGATIAKLCGVDGEAVPWVLSAVTLWKCDLGAMPPAAAPWAAGGMAKLGGKGGEATPW